MPEENGTTPEQQGHINISVSPQGMVLSITQQPINLVIDEAGMKQMVVQWLAAHPDLFDEIVKSRVAQKKTELAIIRDIRGSKLN
jgi:hypothetical protein